MLTDVTMEHYDRTMDVDLRGVLLGMKHGIRAMLERGNGGAIVNWSSIGGLNASPFTSVYSAAKAGVIALTKAAAVEYGAQGHPGQRVCPGFIQTEIMGAALEQYPRRRSRRHAAASALGQAARGRRGRGVPRVRPRVVRHRRDHPGRRRLGAKLA